MIMMILNLVSHFHPGQVEELVTGIPRRHFPGSYQSFTVVPQLMITLCWGVTLGYLMTVSVSAGIKESLGVLVHSVELGFKY